jgi:hypothetical protein
MQVILCLNQRAERVLDRSPSAGVRLGCDLEVGPHGHEA